MNKEVYQEKYERLKNWFNSLELSPPPWEEYELIAVKPLMSVWDTALLDFCAWYFDRTENQYIFMYGLEEPDRNKAIMTAKTFDNAHNWFCNHNNWFFHSI